MGDLKLCAEYTVVDQSLKLLWDAALVPKSFPSVSAPFHLQLQQLGLCTLSDMKELF